MCPSTSLWKRNVLLAGLFLMGLVIDANGQSFQGGLRGEVKDAAAVIPGVTVTLINESTNVSRTTVSNQVGAYVFAAVAPGMYTVRALLTGFKTFERKGLTIGTQQFLTLDLVMEVGTIEESVSVTAAAPLIETSNASTGQVLTKETIEALPALNRNAYMSSAVTVPTVIASGDPYFSRMEDQTNGSLVSLGGGPRRANNYLLDGVSTTDLQNRTSVFVGPEAIGEVKIQVHTYDAEMGRSGGGVFNTTGRSGSNTVHGSVFAQSRPYSLAAADFFAARAGREKLDGPYYRYWGGSLGGPIVRNRSFFWVAHEGYRTNSSATTLLNFPTDRERAGDFSQTFDRSGIPVVIYDPLTTRPNANGTGFTRTPFPGNVIPADRMSKVAKNIAAVMPQPTEQRSGASDGIPNFSSTVQVPTEAEQYFVKGEHKLSDRMSVTGLYLYQNTDELQAHTWGEVNLFAGPGVGAEVRRVHVVALNHLTVPNSTTTLALRFGWTMFRDGVFGTPYDESQLGFPASFLQDVQFQRFPNGTITGYSGFGNRTENSAIYQSWVVNGNVTKLLGRNTVKYGADFRRIGGESRTLGASGGLFSFGREWTQQDPFVARATEGNGFATFLLGYPTTGSVAITTPVDAFINYAAAYIQDDLRLGSKLTLNFGLRYEHETGLQEAENRFTVAFDREAVSPLAARTGLPLRGGFRYAGQDGFPTHQGNPSNRKISPRVGAAWSVNDKTVIRGGYGLFWSPWVYTGSGTTNWGQIGYTQTTFTDTSNQLIPTTSLDNPFPTGLLKPVGSSQGLLTGVGGNVIFVDQDRQSPYVQQTSLDIQRQLPGNTVIAFGYVGARGDHLSYGGSVNINQLRPEQLALGAALSQQVPNPFLGISESAAFSTATTIARGQLLRPFPQFLNVLSNQASGARSRYHALIVQFERRSSGGVGGRFNYTWSRQHDNMFGESTFYNGGTNSAVNNYDLEAEYSRSLLDMPHRVVLAPIVELPFGEGKRWATGGIANHLAGGWTFSMIATFESGFPLNITQADNTSSFSGAQRPNLTGIDPVTSGSAIDRLNNYIDPAAYVAAAPFTFGTAPRADTRIRSPFRINYDMVLARSVPFSQSKRAQIRLEALNATNNPKFQAGGRQINNANFGTISSQAGFPRTIQILVRFTW